MLESITTALNEFVTDFSLRRVFVYAVALLLAALGFSLFEWHSGYFQLTRLQKTSQLIEKALTLQPQVAASKSREIESAYRGFVHDVERIATQPEVVPSVGARLIQGIVAFLPWLVFSLLFIREAPQDPDHARAVLGCIILAFIWAGIGLVIPSQASWWVRFGVHPFGSFIGFLILGAVYPSLLKRERSG